MSTAAAGPFAARHLFVGLFDDAALFPPGNAAMIRAVPAHLGYRGSPDADLVGPFLCPASRLDELRDALDDETSLDLVVVVDTGTGGVAGAVAVVAGDDRLELRGLEVPLRAEPDLGAAARRAAAAVLDAVPPNHSTIFVEVPRSESAGAALDVLAEYDLAAKLRTGGADPSAYPTEDEIAAFVVSCLDREIAFKLTAGLHKAVRSTAAETGFEQHGFVNLLLAVSVALAGGDRALVAVELADRDAQAVADRARRLSTDRAVQIRSWLRSVGTCSIREPIDDLVTIGLVPGTASR